MNEDYPFIQTVTGFDYGISAYAIQPVDENESREVAEENPIRGFGPLGRTNIFVGATNAGKSRFMRMLLKAEKYVFHTEESHQALSNLRRSFAWLINSHETLHFALKTMGRSYHSDYEHPALVGMPSWIKEKLHGVKVHQDYEVSVDFNFFNQINPLVEALPKVHFAASGSTAPASNEKLQSVSDAWIYAVWVKDLLLGEQSARTADEAIQTGYLGYGSAKSIKYLKAFINLGSGFTFGFDDVSAEWRRQFVRFVQACEYFDTLPQTSPAIPPQRIYIPVLRSAVSLSDEDGRRLTYDIFDKTSRRNYGLEDKDISIFTGNRLYDTLKREHNGSESVYGRLQDFYNFLSSAFYEGRDVKVLALDEHYNAGQHIVIRVQGEKERELHDLGDGINTLVILLYQLFMAEPGSWVFIEEPEQNLHPGLQRLFLQTLMENPDLQKRDLRVFFTTHSNHLLRMTLSDGTIASKDVSIFAFEQRADKKNTFLIRPLVSEYHDALTLLGVQNASVLLAQCGVWVEGVTDRQYLRAYLNAYQNSGEFKSKNLRKMREDTHFAFWEYAGSNLSHYLMSDIPTSGTPEAETYDRGDKEVRESIQSSALANRIFLIADQDKGKEKKHEALASIAENRTNFQYYQTPVIEIENLLSPTEINACLPFLFHASSEEKRKAFSPAAFTQSSYKKTRLGSFLKKIYPDQCPARFVAKGGSGTLDTYYKNRLCELAVKEIKWETMSDDAKDLARQLHSFLQKHNNI